MYILNTQTAIIYSLIIQKVNHYFAPFLAITTSINYFITWVIKVAGPPSTQLISSLASNFFMYLLYCLS